jgi:ABC-type uncharacterized transport system auxiliary subunit
MKLKIISLAIPLTALLLTSCGLAKRQDIGIYTLDTNNITQIKTSKCNADLQIAEPTTAPGLDGRRIAVVQDGNKLNYYNNARWVESVPAIMQNFLIESFESSNSFNNITSDTDTANVDLMLLTDIRNFEVAEENGYPLVKLRIVSKLVNRVDYKVLKTITAEENIRPSENKIASIIAAFNEGAGKITGKILKTAAQNCNL